MATTITKSVSVSDICSAKTGATAKSCNAVLLGDTTYVTDYSVNGTDGGESCCSGITTICLNPWIGCPLVFASVTWSSTITESGSTYTFKSSTINGSKATATYELSASQLSAPTFPSPTNSWDSISLKIFNSNAGIPVDINYWVRQNNESGKIIDFGTKSGVGYGSDGTVTLSAISWDTIGTDTVCIQAKAFPRTGYPQTESDMSSTTWDRPGYTLNVKYYKDGVFYTSTYDMYEPNSTVSISNYKITISGYTFSRSNPSGSTITISSSTTVLEMYYITTPKPDAPTLTLSPETYTSATVKASISSITPTRYYFRKGSAPTISYYDYYSDSNPGTWDVTKGSSDYEVYVAYEYNGELSYVSHITVPAKTEQTAITLSVRYYFDGVLDASKNIDDSTTYVKGSMVYRSTYEKTFSGYTFSSSDPSNSYFAVTTDTTLKMYYVKTSTLSAPTVTVSSSTATSADVKATISGITPTAYYFKKGGTPSTSNYDYKNTTGILTGLSKEASSYIMYCVYTYDGYTSPEGHVTIAAKSDLPTLTAPELKAKDNSKTAVVFDVYNDNNDTVTFTGEVMGVSGNVLMSVTDKVISSGTWLSESGDSITFNWSYTSESKIKLKGNFTNKNYYPSATTVMDVWVEKPSEDVPLKIPSVVSNNTANELQLTVTNTNSIYVWVNINGAQRTTSLAPGESISDIKYIWQTVGEQYTFTIYFEPAQSSSGYTTSTKYIETFTRPALQLKAPTITAFDVKYESYKLRIDNTANTEPTKIKSYLNGEYFAEINAGEIYETTTPLEWSVDVGTEITYKCILKADGYLDSEDSNVITITRPDQGQVSEPTLFLNYNSYQLIKFVIANTSNDYEVVAHITGTHNDQEITLTKSGTSTSSVELEDPWAEDETTKTITVYLTAENKKQSVTKTLTKNDGTPLTRPAQNQLNQPTLTLLSNTAASYSIKIASPNSVKTIANITNSLKGISTSEIDPGESIIVGWDWPGATIATADISVYLTSEDTSYSKSDTSTIQVNKSKKSEGYYYSIHKGITIDEAVSKVNAITVTAEQINAVVAAGKYTLPTASATIKGGIKVGSGLKMSGEVLQVDTSSIATKDDLTTKVATDVFNTYVNTTAPNTYVKKENFKANYLDTNDVFYDSDFTAANIIATLGSNAVQKATKDGEGNVINTTYATKTELTDGLATKVSKAGDTMTGTLIAPIIQTGTAASNYFQSRKFRGEGDASTYYHAVDFGYNGHNQVDFYEYGGIWNFWKNTSATATSADSNRVASFQLGKLVERSYTLTYPGKSGTIALTSDIVTYAVATTSANGLMSASDKSKLDGIESGANKYTLPSATESVLGGVKVGSGLAVSNGVVSAKTDGSTIQVGTSGLETKIDGTTIQKGTNGLTAKQVDVSIDISKKLIILKIK